MTVKPIGFAVCLLLLAGAASPSGKKQTANPSDPEKSVGDGSDAIRQRIRLYLERHGDGGRIDPERRLKAVAADYALRRAEAAQRRVGPQGVVGSNWISLGPTNGAGRMTAIAPHPTIAGTLYVGAADGGVWKTTDGGSTWTPMTDDLSDLSVGALVLAPSSPSIIYLGSGEGGYNADFIPGIGLLKSSDGGVTWTLPAAVVASEFYRLSVHPTNPLEIVAGTNQGGLRSTDGGETWTNVISRATYGDVVDMVRHSSAPSTLYAATWCIKDCSAGVGKILKSTDGGVTWVEKSAGLPKTTGLPAGPQSSWFQVQERIALAISPSNPLVLYAATVEYNGGSRTSGSSYPSRIYRTTDGGESWALTGLSRNYLVAQAWYDNTIVVSPNDPNTIFAGGVFYVRSTDGGATFTSPFESTNVHVDAHDLRYQGTTLYIANDGGLWSSPDDGQTASGRNTGLVTQQFYRVGIDPVHRNRILAGAQDTGTSQRPDTGGTEWSVIDGDDGFDCPVNFLAPNFAYFTLPGARIFRIEDAAAATPVFSYVGPLPFNHAEVSPFLTTVAMDPIRPSTIYTGTYRVWRSDNAGDTWLPLPTATADGSVWEASTVVDAIAVSRSQPSALMASKSSPPMVPSNDPSPVQVFRSTDGGATWVAASGGLPPAKVNNLEIDPTDASVAYAAIATTSGPSVYRTTDGGVSWSPRATGLPSFAAQVVRVDPTNRDILYCGVDVGVYRSTDRGASWEKFGSGLPSSSAQDIRIADDGSMLRVATHGRGVWELDVPPTVNTPPSAAISSPSGPLTVPRGMLVTLSGSVSDPDPGDSAIGVWTFPDTWETVTTGCGASSVSHTFAQTGVYRVNLAARDNRGALANASVTITVSTASVTTTAEATEGPSRTLIVGFTDTPCPEIPREPITRVPPRRPVRAR